LFSVGCAIRPMWWCQVMGMGMRIRHACCQGGMGDGVGSRVRWRSS
jgi:hypothetical protein